MKAEFQVSGSKFKVEMEIEEKDGRKKTGVRLINEEFSSQKVKEENEEGT